MEPLKKTEMSDEDLENVTVGYILDRGEDLDHSCRYALIDDKSGEWYCMGVTADAVAEHYKARKNSSQIISLDEYREIFGKDFKYL